MISTVEVNLNSVADVNKFVVDMASFMGNVDIHSEDGRYRVSGNSILGLFSLDLSKPVRAILNSSNKKEHEEFLSVIKQYEVNKC